MVYELYELKSNSVVKTEPYVIGDKLELGVFKPSIFRMCLPNLSPTFKNKITNLYWYFITFGRFRIYYVKAKEKIIHTSYCAPKCYKFPFMSRGDLHIGPCATDSKYRGKGIYPYVLTRIIKDYAKQNISFYMIIEANNIPSQRGVFKVGFIKTMALRKSGLLKVYKIVKQLSI